MIAELLVGCGVALFVGLLTVIGFYVRRLDRVVALLRWQAVALSVLSSHVGVELPELPPGTLEV